MLCFRILRFVIKVIVVLRWRVRCCVRVLDRNVDGLRLGVVLRRVDWNVVVVRRKVRVGSRWRESGSIVRLLVWGNCVIVFVIGWVWWRIVRGSWWWDVRLKFFGIVCIEGELFWMSCGFGFFVFIKFVGSDGIGRRVVVIISKLVFVFSLDILFMSIISLVVERMRKFDEGFVYWGLVVDIVVDFGGVLMVV